MSGLVVPRVHLYEDPSSKTLNLREIVSYLEERLGAFVDTRRTLLTADSAESLEKLARSLARARVRDPMNPNIQIEPLLGEVEFERRLLGNPTLRIPGLLYDGFRLMDILFDLLPRDELHLGHAHIVFTNRLFGTWDEGDGRYHARVSVYGFPALISTTGIVEAPAKPREYYVLKQGYASLGLPVPYEELREKFRGRFIDYDDERMTEVMKGYVMQAIFYHLFGEPFCSDRRCRLANAHWQEEVLEAQLSKPEFCEQHARMLERLKQREFNYRREDE
jgi:predicted Zn-dependent protease